MFGIEGYELTQLLDHFLGDYLRVAVLRFPAYHAMSHRGGIGMRGGAVCHTSAISAGARLWQQQAFSI
jgi:hypothetical protein